MTEWPAPFAPRALLRFHANTRQSVPNRRIGTFGLAGLPLGCDSSCRYGNCGFSEDGLIDTTAGLIVFPRQNTVWTFTATITPEPTKTIFVCIRIGRFDPTELTESQGTGQSV